MIAVHMSDGPAGALFPTADFQLSVDDLTGISWRVIAEALGLQSAQAAAQRWERLTGAVAPAVDDLRRRVTSALLDAGITRSKAQVFVGGGDGRAVVLQLAANGPAETRRQIAEKIIATLGKEGLAITDEGSHSETDMAGYLAEAGMAEVCELS